MDNPLDYIPFSDVLQHGDPGRWKHKGEKQGSVVPATSPLAPPGTLKLYEIYEDEFSQEIEVHYFRHVDGTVSDVKVAPRS